MSRIGEVRTQLRKEPTTWLVTGAAGFVGSHIVEDLLQLGQSVRGLDNFSTGHMSNLDAVQARVAPRVWARFELQEGDVRDPISCARACDGIRHVLHQAAIGSVPKSLADPWTTHTVNVDGFVCLLLAARQAEVHNFVYASSSSVYGDEPTLPKVEGRIGRPLSPYALSKRADELYADVYGQSFGLRLIGLRYFNVVGPRQDPQGPYAAVVPRWIDCLRRGQRPTIYGDGETSRDFCPVANVVQANLLAAKTEQPNAWGRVYNVALGRQTTLKELFVLLRELAAGAGAPCESLEPIFEGFRAGDIRHSLANIDAARDLLGYDPDVTVREGLAAAVKELVGAASS